MDAPPPETPVKTKPLSEEKREAWFEGPDVITAIRIYDGDREYSLPSKPAFTLGASRHCDLALLDSDLSALHCAFVRKGAMLRVIDQNSTNGVFFRGRRVESFDINPGDTFSAAPLTFIAMNDEMRKQRPILSDIVGLNFKPSPDRVLVDAVMTSHHFLLTGETGCDLDRLARAIHAVSLRRTRALVELSELPAERAAQREILRRAERSTLVIDLGAAEQPFDPTFCAMAFSHHQIRIIVLASTPAVARRLIAIEDIEQLQHIWIRPLGTRPGEIPKLLDRMLVERGAQFRLADLTACNYAALCNYDPRDNFIGLRLIADRLTAMSRIAGWDTMNWSERSAALGLPKTTLYDWCRSLGLSSPLFAATENTSRKEREVGPR
jgi:pSer/pThr/pTyr-binding forkhead associated (FHA) protein